MKVKESLKVFKDAYVLFPIYLLKSIILPFGMVDFWILGIIVASGIADKVVDKLENGYNKYIEAKDKVISENTFRAGVNADMNKLLEEVNLLKMITSKQGIFGGKK